MAERSSSGETQTKDAAKTKDATKTPRIAGDGDAVALASILTAAFSDDPVMLWSLGSSEPTQAIFREMIAGCYLKTGFAHIIDGTAASLWLPSGRRPHLPVSREMRISWEVLRSGGFGALRRALSAARIVERSHPQAPHYYLFAVGVLPGQQGQGLGRRIIGEGLAVADRHNAPVYLENSRPRNAPLYEALGFRKRAAIPLPKGAPPLVPMWRDAR